MSAAADRSALGQTRASRRRLADRRADRPRAARSASPSTAASSPAIPATRWPRRWSPTASGSSAARSSITGRAASSPPGSEEPNALVELRTGARREPNTRATTVELYDGLAADSQNRWPSLRYDLLAVNQLVAPFLGAGFYYKTFMWPASFWEKLYEPAIRRAAGLGRAAGDADPDHYEKAHAFCDVLVIGGGPAGLAAALAAGRAGARVILCDEDFRLGGRLLAERRDGRRPAGHDWAAGRRGRAGRRCPMSAIMRADDGVRRL